MTGAALMEDVMTLAVTGLAIAGLARLPPNALAGSAHPHQQLVIGATGVMQEAGLGLQQLYLQNQLALTAMIMIVTATGIMTLITGGQEEFLLMEMTTALLA
jgi:hypothetical protein